MYVRPLTEYCSTVWDPHTKNNIVKMEYIQCKAARFVMNDDRRYSSVTGMLGKKLGRIAERTLSLSYSIRYATI